MNHFSQQEKIEIEKEIEADFKEALEGIKRLPGSSRFGVYVAYVYYYTLFKKIESIPSCKIMVKRIRISNYQKIRLLASSYLKHSLRML